MYYRGAATAIIVYDMTNLASFERAKKWVQELQAQGNPNMVMAPAGNKADLLDARKVTAELRDYPEFSQHRTRWEWFSWTDPLKGRQPHRVVLKSSPHLCFL